MTKKYRLSFGVLVLVTTLSAGGVGTMAQGQSQSLEYRTAPLRGNPDFDDTIDRYLNRKKEKIIDGKPAEEGAYPWQVSLGVAWIADPGSAHFCGGSIYNERWVVTAAHCLKGLQLSDVVIASGTNHLQQGVRRTNAVRFVIHKGYSSKTNDNDIALIELWNPLPLDSKTKAIVPLSTQQEADILKRDVGLTVTGWGAIKEGGGPVRDLLEVTVPFVDRKRCSDPLSYGKDITDNMICAGFSAGGKDACQGDSGGPLISGKVNKDAKLVGIVSWGHGCARPGKYGIYSRVANYTEWITRCVATPESCR